MKEATGEMNMTVITIVAIGAILGLFWFLWPQVRNKITDTWNTIDNSTFDANTGEIKRN